jgi:hypothetical protein
MLLDMLAAVARKTMTIVAADRHKVRRRPRLRASTKAVRKMWSATPLSAA